MPDAPQTTPEPGDGHTEARSPFGLDMAQIAADAERYRPNRATRRHYEKVQRRAERQAARARRR